VLEKIFQDFLPRRELPTVIEVASIRYVHPVRPATSFGKNTAKKGIEMGIDPVLRRTVGKDCGYTVPTIADQSKRVD